MKSSRFHSQKYFPVCFADKIAKFQSMSHFLAKMFGVVYGTACMCWNDNFYFLEPKVHKFWLIQLIVYVINLMCNFSLIFRQPSVDGEIYRNGDHHISALESYPLRRHYTPLLPPAGPIRDPRGSPPKYSSLESHDAPLNLSLSSSSLPSSSSAFSTQISRPSVITCAPMATERTSHYSNVSPPHTPHAVASPKSRQIISGERKGLL